jgi:ATP-dependent protease ClpP protease subunit
MERLHKYLVNRTSKEATLRLYGELGGKVDGDYFAQEIGWLDENTDTIHIRINSPGGSVFQGLSIVGAILGAKAKVITYVDGIAASMAAVIAVAGHQVKMNDFAKLMVHDPFFTDDSGEKVKTLSVRDQRAIGAMKSTLEGILKRRCKADIKVDDMMKKETWLTAEEALTAGLIDEVISTGRNLGNLEPLKMVAILNEEELKNKIADMKELTARLKLAEGADEQAIIQAVDQIETEAKAPVQTLVDRIVAIGRLSGKVTDTNEQELRALAGTDLNAFLAKTELKPEDFKQEQPVRLSDVIAELQKGASGSAGPERDWDWYQKNDPQALRDLKQNDAAKYGKLYKAYWGEELK